MLKNKALNINYNLLIKKAYFKKKNSIKTLLTPLFKS